MENISLLVFQISFHFSAFFQFFSSTSRKKSLEILVNFTFSFCWGIRRVHRRDFHQWNYSVSLSRSKQSLKSVVDIIIVVIGIEKHTTHRKISKWGKKEFLCHTHNSQIFTLAARELSIQILIFSMSCENTSTIVKERRVGEMKKKGYHFQILFSFALRDVKHLISSFFSFPSSSPLLFGILDIVLISLTATRADSRDTRKYFKIMESPPQLSVCCERWEDASDFCDRIARKREGGKGTAHVSKTPAAHSICAPMYHFNKLCVNF